MFCYRGSISLSVPVRCHVSQGKQYLNYYRGSELLSRQRIAIAVVVYTLVECSRICTGFEGDSFREMHL